MQLTNEDNNRAEFIFLSKTPLRHIFLTSYMKLKHLTTMKKTILFFASIFSFTLSVNAQSFQWAQREGDYTTARHITTDDAGNSYVFGRFFLTTTVGRPKSEPDKW